MAAARLDRLQTLALLAVLACLVAPHALRLPWWLDGVVIALFAWRVWLVQSQRRLPPKWLLGLIAVGLNAGVFFEYHTLLGRTGGIALFVGLIGAKLLEARSRRDALLLVYLGYFLVVTNFLFDQSMAMALYLGVMVLAMSTLLVSWHSLGGWQFQPRMAIKQLRFAAVLMLQAVPVMALLFVFFPRIEGPLWRLPQDRASVRSGLADSMSPGSFSNMAQNDEVAFRVAFSGQSPAQTQLYWRGPVFDDYDGRTWSQAPVSAAPPPAIEMLSKDVYRYTMTLEPHQRAWLLALDLPAAAPADARLNDHLQLVSSKPIDKRTRLELTAYRQYQAGATDSADLITRASLLPPQGNPRARALAESWRKLVPAERVNAALRFFGQQGLSYTLSPPLYGANAVDDFLFSGKQGFCEHFAGAFAFVLRAAGVPARVVGGYQGGDMNGDYLIVRQADAHAWTEVWLAGEGWRRVDPTFEVAPARIEQGLASAVNSAELPYLMRLDDNLVKRLRLMLDTAVNGWNQWVIGYTPERQRQVLKRLGIDSLLSSQFIFSFLGGLGALIGALAIWLLWRMRPPRPDAAKREWDRFCRQLARRGVEIRAEEGPQDFAQRAAAALPDRGPAIHAVCEAYLQARYGLDAANPESVARLKQHIAAF